MAGTHDLSSLKSFAQKLEPHQLELCAKWRLRDADGALEARDESRAARQALPGGLLREGKGRGPRPGPGQGPARGQGSARGLPAPPRRAPLAAPPRLRDGHRH